MKTDCAWCGKIIEVRCGHCNGPLIKAQTLNGTFFQWGDAYVCLNGETALIVSAHAVERMPTSHGICVDCFARHRPEKKGSQEGNAESNNPRDRQPPTKRGVR